jgi:precorrin-6B methylase 2
MINSGQSLFGERSTSVYDVLAHLEPGLMLDVGAASGGTTALMLRRSPQSRVIAFEPFP